MSVNISKTNNRKVVYKTTNLINGRWYIGQDRYDNPAYYGSGILLNRAIKKYGKINFVKEILEVCESLEDLNKAEEKWIKDSGALENPQSYNLREGGLRGPIMFGSENSNYGKYPVHMVNATKRSIVCLNDGKIFDKISDAAIFYNTTVNAICRVCKLQRISCKGLIFRYKGEEHLTREKKIRSKNNCPAHNRKKIKCIDLNLIFDSLSVASEYCNKINLKTNRQSIRSVCNNKYKTAANMKWEWYVN